MIETKEHGKDVSRFLDSFLKVVREEMRTMEERMIEKIDHRIDELVERRNIEAGEATEEVIILGSITREEAKKEMLDLLDKNNKLDYGEIAEKLRLDLEQVVEIVEELEKEGKVEEVNEW